MDRRVLKFLCLFFIILIGSGIFGIAKSYAGTESLDDEYVKTFKSEVIRADRDIYDIAMDNLPEDSEKDASLVEAYINEVSMINHISDVCCIDPGNHVIVPSYR